MVKPSSPVWSFGEKSEHAGNFRIHLSKKSGGIFGESFFKNDLHTARKNMKIQQLVSVCFFSAKIAVP